MWRLQLLSRTKELSLPAMCCSFYEAVWKAPDSREGFIHALVLLLCKRWGGQCPSDLNEAKFLSAHQSTRVVLKITREEKSECWGFICPAPWSKMQRCGVMPSKHRTECRVDNLDPKMVSVQECGNAYCSLSIFELLGLGSVSCFAGDDSEGDSALQLDEDG